MSIQTPFEVSGGTSWTTYAEGEAFIDEVISLSGRASKLLIGYSFNGHPIHAVAVGYPAPPAIQTLADVPLFVASQHGVEPSPREAAFALLRDLSFSDDSGTQTRLSSCPIVLIPTASPDGTISHSRHNGAGADLNRDHIRLEQPENRALASIMSLVRPAFIYDGHEGSDAEFELSGIYASPAASPRLNEFGLLLEAAVVALNPSRECGPYPEKVHEGLLHTASFLLGIPAMLMEVPFGLGALEKYTLHLECMTSMYGYYCDNRATFLSVRADALAGYTSEGAMAYAPIHAFDAGVIQPTRGYHVPPGVADEVLSALEIEYLPIADGEGSYFVPMAQPRSPVIPLLLDSGAPRQAFPGQRVDDGPGWYAGQRLAETVRDHMVDLGEGPVRPRMVRFHDGQQVATLWQ